MDLERDEARATNFPRSASWGRCLASGAVRFGTRSAGCKPWAWWSRSKAGERWFVKFPITPSSAPLASVLVRKRKLVAELLDVRKIIEPGIAARAARNASPEQIAEMEAILDRQAEKTRRGESGIEEDSAFHYCLALAADNSVVLRVLDVLMDLLQKSREHILASQGTSGEFARRSPEHRFRHQAEGCGRGRGRHATAPGADRNHCSETSVTQETQSTNGGCKWASYSRSRSATAGSSRRTSRKTYAAGSCWLPTTRASQASRSAGIRILRSVMAFPPKVSPSSPADDETLEKGMAQYTPKQVDVTVVLDDTLCKGLEPWAWAGLEPVNATLKPNGPLIVVSTEAAPTLLKMIHKRDQPYKLGILKGVASFSGMWNYKDDHTDVRVLGAIAKVLPAAVQGGVAGKVHHRKAEGSEEGGFGPDRLRAADDLPGKAGRRESGEAFQLQAARRVADAGRRFHRGRAAGRSLQQRRRVPARASRQAEEVQLAHAASGRRFLHLHQVHAVLAAVPGRIVRRHAGRLL